MNKNIAIEFENVGKQYRLGLVGTGSLQHDINRWWQTSILGKEDPYLKIGEVNDRSTKGHSDYVWALKDISFKVEQGDVVGIIGKNGAGKSTLLKLLSHITAPSTGHITYKGRIASLLEVGTGFHPEMTGRENIYMNGSIMGMSKSEIDRKLEEIVDFAGVERYLDTPVKRYSSGMTVRLGFAVAAFLEPEILVVDEVLTVGDAEFQKKAIGKMGEVSSQGGRTVLFVSHNMSAVRNLCKNGIVLKNGQMDFVGSAEDCVAHYLETSIDDVISYTKVTSKNRNRYECDVIHDVEISEIRLLNRYPESMASDEPIEIELTMKRNSDRRTECQYSVVITDTSDIKILNVVSEMTPIPTDKDIYKVHLSVTPHGLPRGRYKVHIAVGEKDFSQALINYDVAFDLLSFEVKYITKAEQHEYFNYDRSWGMILHNKECITAEIV